MRRLRAADEPDFVALMTDSATTTEFMFDEGQKTIAGARAFFRAITGSYATPSPYFLLVICRRDDPRIIGLCGISNLPGDRIRDCFCCLEIAARGEGYATEAITGLVDYCFRHDIASEFHLYIDARNHRSIRLAERLGCDVRGPQAHPVTGDSCLLYVWRLSRQ
ncbi:MAG TPA: GNAT family N-acetyltransferase [Candidatus Krumholzibacteria bacterium]